MKYGLLAFALLAFALCIYGSLIASDEKSDADELTLHMVGNAHVDLAYRWRWNETVDRVGPDTFEGVLRMMEKATCTFP